MITPKEALDELNHELSAGNIGIITRDNIAKALERAEKEHELLGLYQKMWQLPYGDVKIIELWKQIKQLEEELK